MTADQPIIVEPRIRKEDLWRHPVAFGQAFWPHVELYDKQVEIVESVRDNYQTFVVGANGMGKDFVAAFTILWFFLTRWPCRIITTSATDRHLRVLWDELKNLIWTSVQPLPAERGGPLVLKHQDIRRLRGDGSPSRKCYILGMVAGPDTTEAFGGHWVAHTGDGIPRTLLVEDEASSVPDSHWFKALPWANRTLSVG